MTRIRTMGCVLAVFATCMVTVISAAQADPTYHTCVPATNTGHFNDRNCSIPNGGGTGNWEIADWSHAKKLTFKVKFGGTSFQSYIVESQPWAGGKVEAIVECASGTGSGTITGPSTALMKVKFKHCRTPTAACVSAEGELETKLGWISGPAVGIRLKVPAGVFPKFNCGAFEMRGYSGSVIGAVSGNVNTFGKSTIGTLAVNAKGGQLIHEIEFGGTPETDYLVFAVGSLYATGESTVFTTKGENLDIF